MRCMTERSAKLGTDTVVTMATTEVTGRGRGFVAVATMTGITIETTPTVGENIAIETGERDMTTPMSGDIARESTMIRGHERSIVSDGDVSTVTKQGSSAYYIPLFVASMLQSHNI